MWTEEAARQLEDASDHLRSPYIAFDIVLSLSALAAFIAILAAFSGNYIDDENVFHAVVMFTVFAIEAVSVGLAVADVSIYKYSNMKGFHFLKLVECTFGGLFGLLSSSLAVGFYRARWETYCELNIERGNSQKCICIITSSVLGFAVTSLLC